MPSAHHTIDPAQHADEVFLQPLSLARTLESARRRTLDLVADLTDEQMDVPLLDIINPPVWELGHVAWFQEKWALRHLGSREPIRADGDSFWDSAAVAHDTRWQLPLPSRKGTLRYMEEVLDRVLEGLSHKTELTRDDSYFHWLAIMHEDMHAEALAYTRQTLVYRAPQLSDAPVVSAPLSGNGASGGEDVFVPGGSFQLGANPREWLVFDNEKWAHPVEVQPFAIARAAVTNGQFAEFVNDGGYRREELWIPEGWDWRKRARASSPVYWTADGKKWLIRQFDRVAPLVPEFPIIHVNWYEADAYCRWAGRRLPTESEWELAAAGLGPKRRYPWGDELPSLDRTHLEGARCGCISADALAEGESPYGCRQMIGNVWEWTACDFQPYPGFAADPYKEYSEPWFGSDRKVLRGGCWATRARLIRNTYRNYFTKERRDIFAGFRTCAKTAE